MLADVAAARSAPAPSSRSLATPVRPNASAGIAIEKAIDGHPAIQDSTAAPTVPLDHKKPVP